MQNIHFYSTLIMSRPYAYDLWPGSDCVDLHLMAQNLKPMIQSYDSEFMTYDLNSVNSNS